MRDISKFVMAALAATVAVPAVAAPEQKSEFDRAIERAPREAREQGNREASEKAGREAAANRAGLDHDGRARVGDGVSIGAERREGGGTVNVRIDTDRR